MITEIKGSDLPLEAKIMMYRCCECGHLFEDGEQAVWYENQGECHGVTAMERFSGCPLCHGDYEEVYQCKECGDWHSEDELYDGWCEKCLRNTINYSTFFEYCEAHKEEQYLDTFVMYYILNCEYVPKYSSDEFHELMIDTYKKNVAKSEEYERILRRKEVDCLLDMCIRFVMDDDGYSGRENYADWLNKREVK